MVKPDSSVTHLFLDLDGTLINSLPRLRNIYHDFLSDYKIEGSNQEFDELKTSSIEKLIEYFKVKYSITHPSHHLKKQYEKYLQKHYFKAPLFKGVREFLIDAKEKGYKLILTTANQRAYAQKILNFHKLDDYIQDIYTPGCFDFKQKNDLFYKKVLGELDLNPKDALVIDDSLEVISCSIKSGLRAVLFSKITYHPVPCFGSWKILLKQWTNYVFR